ncbi:MAG: ROK family protein [Acidimicrobiia bacterium]
MPEPLVGAVEAGGTKFRMAMITSALEVVEEGRLPTLDAGSTLDKTAAFFESSRGRLAGVGIACFGPVDLVRSSSTYGSILATPKAGWEGAPVLGRIRQAVGVPTAIESDVGAAAVAEAQVGAGLEKDLVCYVTVGTGIGGAVVADGRVLNGHGHSEVGHIPVERIDGDSFAGACPFHGDCLEGMASGAAADARRSAGEADPGVHTAAYLAQLVQALSYTFAPDIISFGGGLFNRSELLPEVQSLARQRLGGYTTNDSVTDDIARYVVRSPLDQDAGILGAAILGWRAANIGQKENQQGHRTDAQYDP